MKSLTSFLLAAFLILFGVGDASAQLKVNNIELVNATPAVTGNNIITQVGASVSLRNDFSSDIIVSIKDSEGVIQAEVTVEANATVPSVNHGLDEGTYTICARPSGQPATEDVDIGDLNVRP